MNYGINGSLDGFPGNFSVGSDTCEALIEDILTGLAVNDDRMAEVIETTIRPWDLPGLFR